MYAKAQCTNTQNTTEIPVQTYENRDIINALARKNAQTVLSNSNIQNQNSNCRIPEKNPEDCIHNSLCNQNTNKVSSRHKSCFFDKFSGDDLLLIGIILLLLFDGNEECDFLIPILIAVILLN